MITNWARHWGGLAYWNDSTMFTYPMIYWDYNKMPTGSVETIFIKKSKGSGNIEQAWKGIVSNFRNDEYNNNACLRFDVSIKEAIDCPTKYKKMPLGWHAVQDVVANETVTTNSSDELTPPFFNTVLQTKDWASFEQHVYHLLRVLGIHDIYKYPQNDNRGKADGFFKFDNRLAVLYDATLDPNIAKKKQQINNYLDQLAKDTVEFGIKSYTIKGIDKQVWILVQGNGEVKVIRDHDGIKVKLLPVQHLINLYNDRLNNEMDKDKFWDSLKDL